MSSPVQTQVRMIWTRKNKLYIIIGTAILASWPRTWQLVINPVLNASESSGF
jgi:hypothetical protein